MSEHAKLTLHNRFVFIYKLIPITETTFTFNGWAVVRGVAEEERAARRCCLFV